MHLTPVDCPNPKCTDTLSFADTSCKGCGEQDVGYPNVRYAEDPAERAALDARVTAAFASARAEGHLARLEAFELAVTGSWAITVMSPVDLSIVIRKNRLWTSYYKHTRRADSRVAERNKWDMNRGANDGKVNPQYYEEINYAALSLTNYGSGWYGGCHVKLDGERIASRTSVFWQNPFQFLTNVPLNPDEMVPPGYRASWARRGKLAVAKLHDRIGAATAADDFPSILLEVDPTRGDTDFIEVHIYGAVAATAFAQVSVDVSQLDEDEKLDWESVKRRLGKIGIPAVETSGA
jgi:hypothetical protein